ncbi:LacI family DNA-binding transcriptional regulator [Acidisphaera sp. L21]|uniref:LacI family DNA-binding transcriptional regulator n=1 Tax=Acidisphaera sp. L21 TaxID=1641851 RepID=UPI00131E2878|nr:LacI family DNA-binding transcriptional regulator [Acidisphaera sp. L21]
MKHRFPQASPQARPRLRRPTAHDVARVAGLSQSAVSRAFTPGASISDDARLKVLAAAQTLGYRPNMIARSLITERSGTIGLAIGYMENQFYPAILEALSTEFAAAGYRLLLFTQGPRDDSDPLLDEVLRHRVDAVILASVRMTSKFAEECSKAQVPVVLINRRTEAEIASSVTGENRIGAQAIAAFLVAGGHQRFAYMAGLEDSSTSREREEGFSEGLGALGQPAPLRVVGNYDFEAARAGTKRLLLRKQPPDAIFCANDHMAFAVIETARSEFGLTIGRDISVVGFDDVALAAWPSFMLTTYSQPIQPMVHRLVEITLQHIEQGGGDPIRDIVPGALIIRTSARLPQ